jgi:2-polyprenyl-3-methyl-5-hydroxy-6-metoxy-1,4-benzoquinol methylase
MTGLVTAAVGHDAWVGRYDELNDAVELEEPVIRQFLGSLPFSRALDVACGIGRHGAYLAARGHAVTGVDISYGILHSQ